MTPSDLIEILDHHPDRPLRLTLSSGDQITIPNANAAIVAVSHVYLFPNLEGRFSKDFGKYVSIVNIAMVEPVMPAGGAASTN